MARAKTQERYITFCTMGGAKRYQARRTVDAALFVACCTYAGCDFGWSKDTDMWNEPVLTRWKWKAELRSWFGDRAYASRIKGQILPPEQCV